jgi:hypothetical protein
MTRLTGPRATHADYLLFLRRKRYIDAETYAAEKTKLVRQEAAVEKRRAAAAAKAAAAAAARKAATAAKRKETLLLKRTSVLSRGDNIRDRDMLNDFWRPIRNQTVRLMLIDRSTGSALYDLVMTIPHSHREFSRVLLTTVFNLPYDTPLDETPMADNRFMAFKNTEIAAQRLVQTYRDAPVGVCVFIPIFKLMETRMETASKDTARRYKRRIEILHEFQEKYRHGVPESDMEIVAQAAGLKIELHDVLGKPIAVYNKDGKIGTLHLSNTRANHLDEGLVVRSDALEITHDELSHRWNELRAKGEHYEFVGDLKEGVPRRLNTLRGAFTLADPDREVFAKFDEEVGIPHYKINASKYPDLNAFFKAGRVINGWSCSLGNDGETGCLDLGKAYAQFKQAPFYAGFLGRVHQFRSGDFSLDFMREHIGYYRITITEQPVPLFQHLGLYAGMTLVMFSQEALFYAAHGVQFSSDMGAWGHRFHFSFPDYMLENRRYCVWSGRLGSDRETTNTTIPATREFAAHLKSEGHDVMFWEQDGMMTIRQKNTTRMTAHHILGAITAYTRLNLIEAMMKFQPEQLCRVVLDGIYYKGTPPHLPGFNEKPLAPAMSEIGWYSEPVESFSAPPMSAIQRDTMLIGQGGSGKTYGILTDPGFIDLMMVVPTHTLGQSMYKDHKVHYETIHKMVGLECVPYRKDRRIPGVILADELTQYDAAVVEKLRNLYPECLFLVAGDINRKGEAYQVRNGDGQTWSKVWKPTKMDWLEFNEDRRSLDEGLKQLKIAIRAKMDQVRGPGEEDAMADWAKAHLPKDSLDDFQTGDICIAATHRTNKKLIEKGITSGYYKKGGWISDVPESGYEQRGSFTTHSIQGKTVADRKIFVFLDDMFEISMLYTAVSRARYSHQLRFIHSVD